jgi:carboxyl-terminal processing protease
MNFFRKTNTITVTVIIGLLCAVIGWSLGNWTLKLRWNNYVPTFQAVNAQVPPDKAQTLDFKLFWQVWNMVSQDYVDKKQIDPQKMYYGAIQGMVAAVGDPYTMFLPPAAQKATSEDLGGAFEGVGIQLGYDKDKRMVVIAPLVGTPAEAAGVKPGDVIIKINDKDATSMTLPDAVNIIRGPKGTSVKIEVYRDGETATRVFNLQRDTIVVKSANYSAKTSPQGKKIAYISLSRFGERTSEEWNDAVSSILASGAEGVIVDVRNNPGGYLDEAIFISSEFLDPGKTVVFQENSQQVKTPYQVNRQGKLINLPLVVMINKGSASAAEIFSGAMQDYKRGILVGEQSFGKGTVQETHDLDGGTGIHITTAKWLTPNERWIHQIGLTPDIKVDATSSAALDSKGTPKDVQLDKALSVFDGQ